MPADKSRDNINSVANHAQFKGSSVDQTLSLEPFGFVDIGARGGVHEIVEPVARLTKVLCFEPDEAACEELRGELSRNSSWAGIELEPVALAGTEGVSDLHLMATPTNHSLLPGNKSVVDRYNIVTLKEVGTVKVSTTLLDNCLLKKRGQEKHWGEVIKFDAQGAEFEIMQGGKSILRDRTVAIFTEVLFFELYEGQKLFSELELFLRSLGFSFYGFPNLHFRSKKQLDKRIHRGSERLIYADAVFFKDPLAGNPNCGKLDERQQMILFTFALVLGYFDFALELAHETFGKTDRERYRKLVLELATSQPEKAVTDVTQLAERVRRTPASANVEVGRFVDERRKYFDYDDYFARARNADSSQ
ncbi:MAG TPA: FkbM family methyltransferase [Stellaceae bacterium]|jgi:FkbM family methyltransferase|nr:FkbM family methyltransferase [Stellaceae bacterium]